MIPDLPAGRQARFACGNDKFKVFTCRSIKRLFLQGRSVAIAMRKIFNTPLRDPMTFLKMISHGPNKSSCLTDKRFNLLIGQIDIFAIVATLPEIISFIDRPADVFIKYFLFYKAPVEVAQHAAVF